MNNSWKFIGGGGAALAAVVQLWNVYRFLDWGENIIPAVLFLISYAAIAAGFFMAQNEASTVAAPAESTSDKGDNGEIPSVGQWLGWMLLLSIPLVNFILMIIWAIDKENQIRRNWVLAALILTGVVTVLYALAMVAVMGSYGSYGY